MDEWIECDTRDCTAQALIIAHFTLQPDYRDAILGFCRHHGHACMERLKEAANWIEDRTPAEWSVT